MFKQLACKTTGRFAPTWSTKWPTWVCSTQWMPNWPRTDSTFQTTRWVYRPDMCKHLLEFISTEETTQSCCGSKCHYSYIYTGKAFHTISKNTSNVLSVSSNKAFTQNKWQHVAFTFSNATLKSYIYLDGVLTATGTATGGPTNIVRNSNYIGKENPYWNPNANAIFDELKIFSVALTQSQILKEMQNEFYLSSLSQSSIQLSLVSAFVKSKGGLFILRFQNSILNKVFIWLVK
jgi:hypothetical protein